MNFKKFLTIVILCLKVIPIPIYGNTSLGYYYIKGYFGISKSEQTLIFDTGSDKLIIDCNTCSDCGTHTNKVF